MGYLDTMRSFNKLQGHIYYFKPEEFAKMLEIFNLQTIYGLEYAAQMYKSINIENIYLKNLQQNYKKDIKMQKNNIKK